MDNNIIKEIKKLKKDICPRPEWVVLSRDILLQQINPQKKYQPAAVGWGAYLQLFSQVFRQHLLEPAVIMLIVLGVFLGSSLMINAAFYSLPGDRLYPLKIALEKTHVALVPGEEQKVELKIEFAQNRIAEFDKIVQQTNIDPQQKKKKIEAVVKEFKNNVVAVNDHLNKIKRLDNNIAEKDKEQTLRIALSVSSKTEELAKSFDEKAGELPVVEKLEIEEIVAEAVQSAQETSLSAQQLAEDVNQQSAEGGTIEGAQTGEEIKTENDAASEEGKTLEASTVKNEDVGEQVTPETETENEVEVTE